VFRLAFALLALAAAHSQTAAVAAQETPSVWNGVFTAEQAERGKAAYTKHCSRCHGEDLAGRRDYPLTGERFFDHWEAHTLEHLFKLIRDSMPPDAINAVDVNDKRDVMAYLLQRNGFPAGTTELSLDSDVLATFEISRRSGPGPVRTGALVHVTGCLTQPRADWALVNATEPQKTALPTAGSAAAPPAATSGTRTIALLNVFPNPAAHRGHTMTATGFLVKKGDSDAVNVVSLEMVAPGCAQ
jgi:cytochrome c5